MSAADSALTIRVFDWNNRRVTDAEVVAASGVRKEQNRARTFELDRGQWDCRDGTCTTMTFDSDVVDLKIRVESSSLHAAQNFDLCYDQIVSGVANVYFEKPKQPAPSYSPNDSCTSYRTTCYQPANSNCCCCQPPSCSYRPTSVCVASPRPNRADATRENSYQRQAVARSRPRSLERSVQAVPRQRTLSFPQPIVSTWLEELAPKRIPSEPIRQWDTAATPLSRPLVAQANPGL